MTIQNTSTGQIQSLLAGHQAFFAQGHTRDLAFRKSGLRKLRDTILQFAPQITEALYLDLHKSAEEAYLTEISLVLSEINHHLSSLSRWSRPQPPPTPIALLPSRSKVLPQPRGTALIIAPWNYPFQLLFNPLVGALSAGCCAILKPSPYTPHTARVMEQMILHAFPPQHISLVQGDREVNTALLQQRFDLIFFTGSPDLGKIVMQAASAHLSPVVLELGGKSPCIVDDGAKLRVAASRIAWGKSINAGQTCIAPDYLLIKPELIAPFVNYFGQSIAKMYGKDVAASQWFPRMVSDKAFGRVASYLDEGKVLYGGTTNASDRFIHPTLLAEVPPNARVMQDEIFGPVLPIIPYNTLDEAIQFINRRENPLALYFFGKKAAARHVLGSTLAGGSCINDTLLHIANPHLPFGGIGHSGMGHYHGYYSFEAFSHMRALVATPTLFDLPFRYPPFRFFPLVKKIL